MKHKGKLRENKNKKGRHEHPLPGEIKPEDKKKNEAALGQAQEDISNDADLSINNKNADLDEGETARLGEEKTGLI